jgi:spermidine synthase
LLVALVCSGFAALGYEIVWTRLCVPMLGSETLGVLATLAGFFGGMALGALVFHRRASQGPDPLGLFVRLELGAAAYAVVSPHLLHALGRAVPAWLGPTVGNNDTPGAVAAALAVAAVTMLPGTLCLGGTLAAAVEARRRACVDDDGKGVGRLYAANTAGAVVGVMTTIHVVLPMFGLETGAAVLAAVGACAAGLARRWTRTVPRADVPLEYAPVIDTSRDPDPDATETVPLLLLLAGTGVVGVGLEVIGVLVLSQILENTIYTFANVLAVYLGGTAIGAALWGAAGPRWAAGRPATAVAALLVALALATVLAAVATASGLVIVESVAPQGASFAAHLWGELLVAACVFAVPTVLMGALFSHAMGLVAPSGIGRAYAINTAGGAIAPFIFGVWAPLSLGYKDAFYLVVWGYLLVFGVFTWYRRFKAVHQIAAIIGVVAATAMGPRTLVLVEPADGWNVLSKHESASGLVVVSEKPAATPAGSKTPPQRRLQIGRHFRMGGSESFAERRLGHLPLLLSPGAERALFLGVGTGATLGAVGSYDALVHIDAVELVREVLGELPKFAAINGDVAEDPRVVFHAADARRFVAAVAEPYDVVVADLFHPGIDGAGALYAREHFENVDRALAEGGLFAQWLPLHQLDVQTLPMVACTFAAVFPEAHAFLGVYNVRTPGLALVARKGGAPLEIDVDVLAARVAAPVYRELLFDDIRDLLASRLLDPAGVAALCGGAPLNTDLWPRITLQAPVAAYETAADRGSLALAQILGLRAPVPASMLRGDATDRDALAAEVAAFSSALASYLEGERLWQQAREGPVPQAAIDRYLESLAAAPEFAPTRGSLLRAARTSGAVAEQVLPRLVEAAPNQRHVWEAWINHLRRTGDEARAAEAIAAAQARFGAPTNPVATPEP